MAGLGLLLAGRGEIEMSQRDVELLQAIEGTLKKLHLSLYCQRCQALGNPDGVRAANHPNDTTWTVTCGCSVRIQRRQP